MSEGPRLRPTTDDDLGWLVREELRPEFAAYIHRWPEDRHRENLSDPDYRYLIAEDATKPVGYIILRGIETPERSIGLVRIVVIEPGRGLGRRLLARIMDVAFGDLGANRLWLDVFDDNERARRAYQASGFVEEGLLRDSCLRGDGRLGSLVVMSVLKREYQKVQITI